MAQDVRAMPLGQVAIEPQYLGASPVLRLGELVKKVEGVVGMLDDLEVIGQRVGREDPSEGGDVCRILFYGEDRQRGVWCRSLHDRISLVRAVNTSLTRAVGTICRRVRALTGRRRLTAEDNAA